MILQQGIAAIARGQLAVGLLCCCLGCTTYAQRVTQIRSAYYENGIATADTLLSTAIQKDRVNSDVLKLDRAMIQLTGGQVREAEQSLREVRDHFDALEGTNLGETTLAYLTDDTHRAYAGEDYEKVLIRGLLSLTNLLHDGGDAGAYALQTIDKQQEIIELGRDKNGENPKQAYQRVALAPYLIGMLREATHTHYDDAERNYATLLEWHPKFLAGRADWERARSGHHSRRGHGVLYLFTLVGRGPYKEAVNEVPSSASLLIAGEILSATGKQTITPNVAAIKVPRVVATTNNVQTVAVRVGDQLVGYTETVTDVTQLAIEQYRAIYPQVIARAVARRCLKKAMIYGTKEVASTQRGSLSNVAFDVAGIVWEATENPDTRCWGLLPDKIQVIRVELPVGEYPIALQAVNHEGGLASPLHVERVRIADGQNSYMLANFPQTQLIGRMLVKEP